MVFFKKPYILRRYSRPVYTKGHASVTYQDMQFLMDVQTEEDTVKMGEDGAKSAQKLKVFCDSPLLVEDAGRQQKADRLLFQGKWFACQNSRLSENTILRHYTAAFTECPDQEELPETEAAGPGNTGNAEGSGANDAGGSKRLSV